MKSDFSRDPVVVIGGGVAGLTAANLLARDGFKVAIFEAGNKLGGCCATTTLNGYRSTVPAEETKEETITPPVEFTKDDFADECYLKVNWIVENTEKEKAYRMTGVSEIKLLPVGKVKWDLVNPAGKPVAKEFLFASLAAWSMSREGTVLKRAEQLRQGADASQPQKRQPREWVKSCYEDLFTGPSALVLDSTARSYPFAGEKTVATPRKVLAAGAAEPLEAAFLMAAMIRAATATHRARITLFVLPRAQALRDPSILLAWSLPNARVWEAIDLREAKNLSFDENVTQSGTRLRDLLKQRPEFLASLRTRGVVAAADSEPTALAFDRAVEEFRIRALE